MYVSISSMKFSSLELSRFCMITANINWNSTNKTPGIVGTYWSNRYQTERPWGIHSHISNQSLNWRAKCKTKSKHKPHDIRKYQTKDLHDNLDCFFLRNPLKKNSIQSSTIQDFLQQAFHAVSLESSTDRENPIYESRLLSSIKIRSCLSKNMIINEIRYKKIRCKDQ